MNCAWQGERIARHNCLRDTLHKTAAAAALGPTKEGRFLLPGEGGKPTDIFIPRWAGGKDAALDVTIVNPLQDALVQEASLTAGHALSVAHKRKLDKSWESCRRQGIEFIPIAAESLGAWHSSAIEEVKKLGSLLARHTQGRTRQCQCSGCFSSCLYPSCVETQHSSTIAAHLRSGSRGTM